MNNIDLKKLIIPNIPYLLFVWLFDKAAQAFRLSPGADLPEKLLALGTGFSAAFENAAPSLHPMDFPQPLKMLRRAYTLWTCLSAQRGRCLSG